MKSLREKLRKWIKKEDNTNNKKNNNDRGENKTRTKESENKNANKIKNKGKEGNVTDRIEESRITSTKGRLEVKIRDVTKQTDIKYNKRRRQILTSKH